MHRFAALALTLAIPVAALAAPLVHVHPDSHATAHHSGTTVHSHWAGHGHPATRDHRHDDDHGGRAATALAAAGGPIADEADGDRAVFFSMYVAVTPSALPMPGVVPNAFTLPVPLERAAHPNVEVTHGHDPPVSRSLPARAPPSLPVLL